MKDTSEQLKVPFSENEIAALRVARGIKGAWWQNRKQGGSGWHRDLYTQIYRSRGGPCFQ